MIPNLTDGIQYICHIILNEFYLEFQSYIEKSIYNKSKLILNKHELFEYTQNTSIVEYIDSFKPNYNNILKALQ